MKQHISLSDLNQLSDKGKERLREWILKQTEQVRCAVCGSYQVEHHQDENGWHKSIMSIGQLIQFLDEEKPELIRIDGYNLEFLWMKDEELCDSLWMAVKDILER